MHPETIVSRHFDSIAFRVHSAAIAYVAELARERVVSLPVQDSAMRFKVDENLPVEVAQLAREAGHEAATVLDQDLGGRDDRAVAAICQQEARALVTLDLDFADIRTYPPAH